MGILNPVEPCTRCLPTSQIYCPLDSMPSSCEWRGSGSCHGQCHAGETTLFHSKHGSYACLAPGLQAFCCASNTWSALVNNCGWTGNCDACPSDRSNSVSHRKAYFSGKGGCTENFCCGYNFQGCHWIGKGTCDDNECSKYVRLSSMGVCTDGIAPMSR